MSEVTWKTLIYNGKMFEKFEVSTTGHIRNARTRKIYKTFVNKKGYEQICVSLGSAKNKKVFKIHRAIAETFLENKECKPEVNHKDGNKLNNNLWNLEWSTGSENMQHASQAGLLNPLCGPNNPNAKLSKEDVKYIRDHYAPYNSEYGARALGRKFHIDKGTILKIIAGVSYVNV